jgi:predicted transcriptional regulator
METSDMLHLTICSDLRRNLLVILNEHEKSLGELREGLKISSTTALHALRELEKSNLTFQNKQNKKYGLTNLGKIMAIKLMDYINAVEVLKKHERFWLEHDLSGIPDQFLRGIGALSDSEVIKINALDIIKTHNSYIDSIKTAQWIKGVSPIFSSDYPIVFKEIVEKNISTTLILTDPVLEKLTDSIGLENLKKYIYNYSLELLITEDLKVAFTVTDSFLSFGLFNTDSVYDTAYDLISTDEEAIRWGSELFEYYKGKSRNYEI